MALVCRRPLGFKTLENQDSSVEDSIALYQLSLESNTAIGRKARNGPTIVYEFLETSLIFTTCQQQGGHEHVETNAWSIVGCNRDAKFSIVSSSSGATSVQCTFVADSNTPSWEYTTDTTTMSNSWRYVHFLSCVCIVVVSVFAPPSLLIHSNMMHIV